MDTIRNMQQEEERNGVIVYFVLGAPGAGKGTLCAKLAEDFPMYHLSTGDFLRALNKGKKLDSDVVGDTGIDLDWYLRHRRLLPPDVIVATLADKIRSEYLHGHDEFLIDGFPRTEESAALFEELVGQIHQLFIEF